VKRREPTDYDDAVADGKIVVLIASGNETTDDTDKHRSSS
jgi:hypothetical protein